MKVVIEATSADAIKSVTSDSEIESCYVKVDDSAKKIDTAVDADLIARLEKDYALTD